MQHQIRLLLSIMLLTLMPFAFVSCDELISAAEREIVGEYVSDDGTCHVIFYSDLDGQWAYSDGRRFSFDWEATGSRLYIRTYDFNGWYRYDVTAAGTLIIYDFDQYGNLVLLRRRGSSYYDW